MPSLVLPRVLMSVLAGALCGLVITCGVLVAQEPTRVGLARTDARVEAVGVARDDAAGEVSAARAVLRRWDAARAGAWASGDTAALAALYTPGSVAGARDVAMLAAWVERDVVVSALTTQVLRLQVLLERPRRLVLVVTDRVASVQAVGARLPQDRPTTRRLELLRSDAGAWQVASVSPERPARSGASR